jgi:RimJ/RimL family protein N-acetyltransferase
MAHPYWPLFDLRVETPLLELRYPDDALLLELAALAGRGVHPPDFMPFLNTWSLLPSPERERSVLKWHWSQRGQHEPKSWNLAMCALHEGQVVGVQGFGAQQFGRVRTISSGSWIGLEHQGRGFGKEMRGAMLHLAFAGLGAEAAYSGAWEDNAASIAVSRGLGYADNGEKRLPRGGDDSDGVGREILFRLDRAEWERRRRDDIAIHGLEECLPLLVGT